MKDFTIDEQYMTSVTIRDVTYRAKDPQNPTPDELMEILKHGLIKWSSTSSDDHPEFKKLREQLGATGYIEIERGWWNGDRVLKPFTLNGMKFKKGEQFSCGGAMGVTFAVKKKYKK